VGEAESKKSRLDRWADEHPFLLLLIAAAVLVGLLCRKQIGQQIDDYQTTTPAQRAMKAHVEHCAKQGLRFVGMIGDDVECRP
jgi:hypothetical protein